MNTEEQSKTSLQDVKSMQSEVHKMLKFEEYLFMQEIDRDKRDIKLAKREEIRKDNLRKANETRTKVIMLVLFVLFVILFSIISSMACKENDTYSNSKDENLEVTQDIPVEIIDKSISEEILFPPETNLETHTEVFKATAYCSCEKCCGIWASKRGDGPVIGAAGVPLIEGYSIAVDDSMFEYGQTFVDSEGNEYRADDCGGAIQGNRIDVYFEDHQKALEFGVQEIELTWVIEE